MGNLFRKQSGEKAEGEPDGEKHDYKERITWNREVEFLLTLIGFSVGFGNLWRFPYLCMRNGGGAFLVPYFFFLIVCGIPLFYLEVAVCQFSSRSPICVWDAVPLFRGLGWGMTAVSGIITIYYNVILAWTLFYLARSFSAVLPWGNCNNPWNTPGCNDLVNLTKDATLNVTGVLINATGQHQAEQLSLNIFNTTDDMSPSHVWKKSTPVEEFWQYETLQLTDGIDNLGRIRWELMLCLMAAWVVVFLCLCKGIRSSGKVIYVTATVPYLFLTVLLIRSVLLPGALDGIKFYLLPDFKRLANTKVWGEACLQIFYTLGNGWGGLMTMASYNKFHQNCLRDSLVTSFVCCGTSFYAGFVIFSIIGFIAKEANLEVSEVLTTGPGLAFMVYPDALTKLPISPMWSVFFFLMLLTVGLDTQFATFETVVTGLVDRYPRYLKHRKTMFTGILCLLGFVLGLPMITQGGMYLFQIVDWYAAAFSLIVIGFLECIALTYFYGLSRLEHDINMMLGHGINIFWKICWKFVTPLCLFGMIIFSIFEWQPPIYGEYRYPPWAITLGWLMAMYSVIPIPIVAVFEILKEKGPLLQRIKKLLRPTEDWGPTLKTNRIGSKYYETDQNDHVQDVPLYNVVKENS